jgi:hypothetical protein
MRTRYARNAAEGMRTLVGADLDLPLPDQAAREKSPDHAVQIALAHAAGVGGLESRWPHAIRFLEDRSTEMALS